jgi:hypothetical protein
MGVRDQFSQFLKIGSALRFLPLLISFNQGSSDFHVDWVELDDWLNIDSNGFFNLVSEGKYDLSPCINGFLKSVVHCWFSLGNFLEPILQGHESVVSFLDPSLVNVLSVSSPPSGVLNISKEFGNSINGLEDF